MAGKGGVPPSPAPDGATSPARGEVKGAVLPPEQARRLACLALAVESRTPGMEPAAIVARAQTYDAFVRGNPYAEIDPADAG